VNESRDALVERIIGFQEDLTAMFTGKGDLNAYADIRRELLSTPEYADLVPTFIRRCRDGGSLWSFAKSVDPSWEPRRQFVREQFEPLLDHLETVGSAARAPMPSDYDSSAWTGVQAPAQRAHAIKTLIPVAQAAIETLIQHLKQPNHNGGPPLQEVEDALVHLSKLHVALGELLAATEGGQFSAPLAEGLIAEAARYGRRTAKALKDDPLPYALSATLLAIFTACGFPGTGGFLGGMAASIRKSQK